ncbi:hypothetical protein HL653_11450 [Sphingomonas sp. AP4-R1]|uniref:FecR family protein n=1 Tax=Sphingomonas sp. AP4-R1 TaxID=2735134 RepID=UPI0014932E11|nr:FecR domain-containing protein [Sphingomonas sp. AP4-R1]QJU58317.1 hypothetical protein HL653_11450 [Sphingomonas sp. AP4-R1]
MAEREPSDAIDAAAADWAARIDRGALHEADDVALDAWLAGDIRRVGALARAEAVMARAEAARALGTGYDPAAFSAVQQSVADQPIGRRISRRHVLRAGGAALAASGVGALGLSLFRPAQSFATAIGEMRRVTLADGSIVILNTASDITVHLSDTKRAITVSRGEVLFEVAKDATRPFIVTAGPMQVRAVGTAFAVRRDADKPVRVMVSEGVVEVGSTGPDARPPLRLVHNMRADLPANHDTIETGAIDEAAIERTLSWREGRITFSDTTLAEAAAEFARYNDKPIVIPNPQVAAHRISGAFSASDPAGFAAAVAQSYSLRVTDSGSQIRIDG